jgi:ribosomal protein S18 acetylase RimI-like enzyme
MQKPPEPKLSVGLSQNFPNRPTHLLPVCRSSFDQTTIAAVALRTQRSTSLVRECVKATGEKQVPQQTAVAVPHPSTLPQLCGIVTQWHDDPTTTYGRREMNESVVIRQGTSDDVPALQSLWLSIHHRHSEVMPELAPYIEDRESWRLRSEYYARLMKSESSILLVAVDEDDVVGYGLAHVDDAKDTWVADTWNTRNSIGEIDSLGVEPAYQNLGIGTELLSRLIDQLNARQVTDIVLGVVSGNHSAIRLYEKFGFTPTFTYLARFSNRAATRHPVGRT